MEEKENNFSLFKECKKFLKDSKHKREIKVKISKQAGAELGQAQPKLESKSLIVLIN